MHYKLVPGVNIDSLISYCPVQYKHILLRALLKYISISFDLTEHFTFSEIQPIFEELKLVLIGSQGAGKSTIANAILKEKVFTFWTSFRSDYIKKTRRVSGTQIHLTPQTCNCLLCTGFI